MVFVTVLNHKRCIDKIMVSASMVKLLYSAQYSIIII